MKKNLMKIFKLFTPPIVILALKKLLFTYRHYELFDGINKDFIKFAKNAKIYGEYGVGLSTEFVANKLKIKVIGVDSSKEWINKVNKSITSHNAMIIHVDVGELREWGRPKDYSKRENFHKYIEGLWEFDIKPDFVLIDGRFRVACFLTCLLNATENTIIAFDDYIGRPHYHIVEEVLKPFLKNERQAFFKTNNKIDIIKIEKLLSKFIYVME